MNSNLIIYDSKGKPINKNYLEAEELINYILEKPFEEQNNNHDSTSIDDNHVTKLINNLNSPSGLWQVYIEIITVYCNKPELFNDWNKFDDPDILLNEDFNELVITGKIPYSFTTNDQHTNDQHTNSHPGFNLKRVPNISIQSISEDSSKGLRNLLKIKSLNLDFYCKLRMIKIIAINTADKNSEKKKLSNIEESQNNLAEKFEKQSESEIQEVTNHIKSTVYTDFISLLGIFTAIAFAIFGGINTINSISSNLNISSNSPQNLGNLLIGAAVLGIVLFGIITVLFAGIAKIAEKNYNLPSLLTISVLAIISAMFMIGLVFTFLANNWNLSIWPQIIISVVVIAVIAVAIFTKCKSNKF